MDLCQETRIRLARDEIAGLCLSVPEWESIAKHGGRGFVRHGGVTKAQSCLPQGSKVAYEVHAEPLRRGDGKAHLFWGTRNSMQNLLLPAFCAERTPKLLRRDDEPWQTATYHAFVSYRDGACAMEQVRFVAGAGSEPDRVEVRTGPTWTPREDVAWAVVGQPILWDGQVPPLDRLAPLTYDLRHIWRLHWEDRQAEGRHCPRDAHIHAELMDTFMANLTAPVATRGALLCDVAARYGLRVEDGYLHSSMGLDAEGGIVLLARHGSLTDIGEAQRAAGAQRAILLDNGGSVGYAYLPSDGKDLRFFGNGSYFRPRGHAVIVASLTKDLIEPPFRKEARLDIDVAAILPKRADRRSTFVDHVQRDLDGRAEDRVVLHFDDPRGWQQVTIPTLTSSAAGRALSAEFAAVTINNHAVLYGSRKVYVEAGPGFSQTVRRAFYERFDRVKRGTGIGSGAVAGYLSFYNGVEFAIEAGRPAPQKVSRTRGASGPVSPVGGAAAVGIDIGTTHIKTVVLKGESVLAHHEVETRPGEGQGEYTTAFLLGRIEKEIHGVCHDADVDLQRIEAIGIAWPGAVNAGRIAGTSNPLRGMRDLEDPKTGDFIKEKFAWFRDLASRVREQIGVRCPAFLINDGNVNAFYVSTQESRRPVLLAQLGGSIAGGYVDAEGYTDYLAELGRLVLDLAADAPAHTFTRIRGISRELVTTAALHRLMIDEGAVDGFQEEPLTRFNASKVANDILTADRRGRSYEKTLRAVRTVGNALGHLLVAIVRQMPADCIYLSGGVLANGSKVGEVLQQEAAAALKQFAPKVQLHHWAGDEYQGARGAAWYALQRAHKRPK